MAGPRTHSFVTIATALAALTVVLTVVQPASAVCRACIPTTICRPQDQIWLISTRHLPTLAFRSKRCVPTYCYYRYCPGCGWRQSCQREFLCCQVPDSINTMYVHGNRRSEAEAGHDGLHVYCRLAAGAPCRPIRHVIWSWPSGELPSRYAMLRDVRVKYRRTTPQSYYLACWLADMHGTGRWTLIGYSYGARTVVGALHLRSGGTLKGYCLPQRCHCRDHRYRVVLWAAATQRDWLCPSGPHGCAFCCVQNGLVLYNPCDRILRHFDRVILTACSPALGLTGLGSLPCFTALSQIDASGFVGRSHNWWHYVQSECLMAYVRWQAFW